MKRARLLLLAILGVVATMRAAAPVVPAVVLGHSMEPTLRPGSVYVLHRGYYQTHPIQRDDVVVLRHQGHTYIKRIYALPGDRILLLRFAEGGSDEIIDPAKATLIRRAQAAGHMGDLRLSPLTIPPGYCYVLGDNFYASVDSRDFGPVPLDSIMGRADL